MSELRTVVLSGLFSLVISAFAAYLACEPLFWLVLLSYLNIAVVIVSYLKDRLWFAVHFPTLKAACSVVLMGASALVALALFVGMAYILIVLEDHAPDSMLLWLGFAFVCLCFVLMCAASLLDLRDSTWRGFDKTGQINLHATMPEDESSSER